MRLVEVTWVDACSEDEIIDLGCAANMKPLLRKNVGYLLQEEKDKIVLAFGSIENIYKGKTGYDDTFAIPKGMIKEIIELKGGDA